MAAGAVDVADIAALLGVSGPQRSVPRNSAKPMMALSWVRSSWLMVARNSRLGAVAGVRDLEGGGEVGGLRLETALLFHELGQGGAQMVGCGGRDVRNNLLATADEAKLKAPPTSSSPAATESRTSQVLAPIGSVAMR